MTKRLMTAFFAALLLLSGCGSDDGDESGTGSSDDTADEAQAGDDDGSASNLEESVDELVEGLEEQQSNEGGGSAVLTVGDEEWRFDSVLCAFGPEEIGQEGAELVVSSIQDGLQFYVSIDDFGHSVSVDDIEDFENPSVSLSSRGEDFIVVDGKNVSGQAAFSDGEDPTDPGTEGSFEVTCP